MSNITNIEIKDLIEALANTAGTTLKLTTEFMESSIELNAKVYYLTESAEDEAYADEGFGGEYSLAFYNDSMTFGLPFEHIVDIRKIEVAEKGWVSFEIRMYNGDVYRVGNATD